MADSHTFSSDLLLSVDDLSISFGERAVVKSVSFQIRKGETLALVGESGSGKSVTALSIPRLLPYPFASHPQGRILFKGQDLLKASPKELCRLRGKKICLIFQEPMTSLNPLHSVGKQIQEVLEQQESSAKTREDILSLLRRVRLHNVEQKYDAYPHQLSGGERQRVMIAMALAGRPDLLIADEPTTALDVTTQAEILSLLKELQQEFGMALLLITHDLTLVQKMARNVLVMERGLLVEKGPTPVLLTQPQHPYTQKLLSSALEESIVPLKESADPKNTKDSSAASPFSTPPVLRLDHVSVRFPLKTGFFRRTTGWISPVQDMNFSLRSAETLGVVGESGSGKTTLALAILRLIKAQGDLWLEDQCLSRLSQHQMRPYRRNLQIVFQDPFAVLSPRMTVEEILGEGLEVHEPSLKPHERQHKISEMLAQVGLEEDMKDRYPHEFSGGQRQRIALARALILKPKVLVLDEPTSALDLSVQKDILHILHNLQQKEKMSYILISHDLRVIRAMSHLVMVMKDGRVVETGSCQQIFQCPQHPYTQALLDAAFLTAVSG